MPMMAPQSLKSADFTKVKKSWYLENENSLITHQGLFYDKE